MNTLTVRKKKPSFVTAHSSTKRTFAIEAEKVLTPLQLRIIRQRLPDFLLIRFQTEGQVRWVINEYLPKLEGLSPNSLLLELDQLQYEVFSKMPKFKLTEEQKKFLKRMRGRLLSESDKYRLLQAEDYSRVVSACVAFKVRLYVPPKGKRMAVVDRRIPKVWKRAWQRCQTPVL